MHLRHAQQHANWPGLPQHEFLARDVASNSLRRQRDLRPRPPRQRHPEPIPILPGQPGCLGPPLREPRPAPLRDPGGRRGEPGALRVRASPPHRRQPAASDGSAGQAPDELALNGAPVIIAGDFNDWRNHADDCLTSRARRHRSLRVDPRPAGPQLSEHPAGAAPRPHLRARLWQWTRSSVHHGPPGMHIRPRGVPPSLRPQ